MHGGRLSTIFPKPCRRTPNPFLSWHSACSSGALRRPPAASSENLTGECSLLAGQKGGATRMLERPNQVLVIDDDEAAREILVELLGRVGYHAFAAADGRSGLDHLNSAAVPPQAVLLDLRMPGIDGFEVLRRYRAQGGIAPVIALSAMDDKESVVKAMRLGASDYLVKPIEPEQLREAIERCNAQGKSQTEVPAVSPARPEPPPVVVREPPPPAPVVVNGARRGPPADFVSM